MALLLPLWPLLLSLLNGDFLLPPLSYWHSSRAHSQSTAFPVLSLNNLTYSHLPNTMMPKFSSWDLISYTFCTSPLRYSIDTSELHAWNKLIPLSQSLSSLVFSILFRGCTDGMCISKRHVHMETQNVNLLEISFTDVIKFRISR